MQKNTFRSNSRKNLSILCSAILITCLFVPTTSFAEEKTTVVQTFVLEEAAIKDIMTQVRSLFGVHNVAADQTLRQLTLRDSPEVVEAAGRLIERLDKAPGEIDLDVELFVLDAAARKAVGEFSGDVLSKEEWKRLMQHGKSLPTPNLRITDGYGNSAEVSKMSEHMLSEGGTAGYLRVGYELKVSVRIHSKSDEATLKTTLNFSDGRPGTGDGGPIVDSGKLESSFRAASGDTIVLRELFGAAPGGLLAQSLGLPEGGEIILALTPNIVRKTPWSDEDLQALCLGGNEQVEPCAD